MTEPTTYRIDKSIKADAYAIFKQLGLKPSQAINLFLSQVAIRGGIPFELKSKIPNAETIAAMKEAENPENLQSFENVEDLLTSIDE